MAGAAAVWRFTRALLRQPGESAVNGLRAVDRGAPSAEGLAAEHRSYAGALKHAGLTVEILPALEPFPDSLFVEDTALVFPEAAILLRPGAASRFGEAAAIAPALRERFPVLHALPGPGFVDGGDVLVTQPRVYIGLSQRTDEAGAEALAEILRGIGRQAEIVAPPPGVLHLKSACALVDRMTLLATRALADSGIFADFSVVGVPEGEEAAANAVRVNDVVLLAAGYPRTEALLRGLGLNPIPLPVCEVAKLDAGLSCMSLRW